MEVTLLTSLSPEWWEPYAPKVATGVIAACIALIAHRVFGTAVAWWGFLAIGFGVGVSFGWMPLKWAILSVIPVLLSLFIFVWRGPNRAEEDLDSDLVLCQPCGEKYDLGKR